MEKIKVFLNKNLLIHSIVLIVTLFIIHFILKVFDLKLRNWVYTVVISISAILFSIFLIKKFIQTDKKTKLDIVYGIAIFIVLCAIFWKFLLVGFFFLIIGINPKSEHVVERENIKYVAVVETGFLHTNVYFHKYINVFVMNSEVEFSENYNGSYDPIEREKEESEQSPEKENTMKVQEETDSHKLTEENTTESENILYEKK